MFSSISLLVRIAAVLLFATSIAAGQQSLTTEQWRQDLAYLAKELPRHHKNAFHTTTREKFEAAVAELNAAIPTLQPHEVVVGMMRIVATIGDAHTELSGFGEGFHRFPLNAYWFGKELRVTRVSSRYKQAAGAKIVKIGEIQINDANARLEQLIAHENEYWVKLLSSGFIPYAELLHALKIIPNLQQASWTFADDSGKQFPLDIDTVAQGDAIEWISASPQLPLYRQKPEEQFWSTWLADSQTIYVNFKGYREKFDERATELVNLLKQKPVKRLVIDVRQNRGGDFTKVRNLLLPELKKLSAFRNPGSFYVITGRATQSAAVVNAIDFRKEMKAFLVGEPTGGRPNGYSEHGDFKLPNSKLTISYSSRYYKFQDTDTSAVMPDKLIEPEWQAYKAGRDPVLDWILSQ
jgi:hypothetical protein